MLTRKDVLKTESFKKKLTLLQEFLGLLDKFLLFILVLVFLFLRAGQNTPVRAVP